MMKRNLIYIMSAVALLLGSNLLTINVRAQDSGVGYITFSSNRRGNYDIYMIDRHGEDLQKLIGGRANEVHARWSPNGRFLAYASDENAAFHDIYVMDMRNKQRWRLTDHPANDTTPTWSPDGKWIAFISNRSGKYRIYRMDIEGEKLSQLTKGGDDWGPSWSPDGKWIAFNTLQPDKFIYLFVMSADGRKPRRLTRSAEHGPYSAWSPDSKRLAHATWELGRGIKIATIDLEGGNPRRVTLGGINVRGRPIMNHSPAWSPDGKWIAYVSGSFEFEHQSSIYVVDAAGEEHADSIQLTTHLSRNMSPAWVPEPFFSVSPSAETQATVWGRLKKSGNLGK
jgi:TolB protein